MRNSLIYFTLLYLCIFDYIYAFKNSKLDSIYGIDVSHYQGKIDWQKVKNSGITFAYIKASQGDHVIDPNFSANWSEAKKVNILRGAYHFFEPSLNVENQAKLFIKLINLHGGCTGSLPPALDVETINQVSKEQLKFKIDKWLKIVEDETNCRPIIYTNLAFWNQYFTNDEFPNHELWLAEYSKDSVLIQKWKKEILWQFTDKNIIDGIRTKVDEDRFIGTKAELNSLICD